MRAADPEAKRDGRGGHGPVLACIFCLAGLLMLPIDVRGAARQFLLKWGGYGNADGKFLAVRGIAVSPEGHILVVDNDRCRVQKFSQRGDLIDAWGSFGDGSQQFRGPTDVAVDSHGNTFVTDYAGKLVKKFAQDGTLQAQWQDWPADYPGPPNPVYIAIDPFDNAYVTMDPSYFGKFDNAGQLLYRGPSPLTRRELYGVAVGPSGNVYVADNENRKIIKLDAAGNTLGSWLTLGIFGPDYVRRPLGIAVDPSDNIFITTSRPSVVEYTATGDLKDEWGDHGFADGQFDIPWDIAIDGYGNLYVTDAGRDDVQKFGDPLVPVLGKSWGSVKKRYR